MGLNILKVELIGTILEYELTLERIKARYIIVLLTETEIQLKMKSN